MSYAFIGLGNMAAAILRGMRQSGRYDHDAIWGYDVLAAQVQALQDDVGLTPAHSVAEAAGQADVIVLAVKPQMMAEVLKGLKDSLTPQKLVVTIAAGLPLHFYEDILGTDIPLVRVMPSLNARVQAAASSMCWNAAATEDHRATARAVFESVGTVEELPEHLFAAFSAIAGAAPAFAFQFVDALASAGVKAGLPRALAKRTASQMMLGSAKLLQQSPEHPRQLMDQVCSPGGTTIQGVHALAKHGFDAAVHAAVDAVIEKDQALGRKL